MRLIAALLLMTFTAPAWAEWIYYASINDGKGGRTQFYYDRTTVKKSGHILRLWQLKNYENPGPLNSSSTRYLAETDCKQKRSRVLSETHYSSRDAGGVVVGSTNTPADWTDTPPGTVRDDLRLILCFGI